MKDAVCESNGTIRVNLKEYLEKLIDERDARYTDKFTAAEKAVTTALAAAEKAVAAALAAQEKLTTASFVSSEKAIAKAEGAAHENDIKNNEFRGQLKDQAATLMPRPETMAIVAAVTEKVDRIAAEVGAIRESRSAGEGASKVSIPLMIGLAGTIGGLIAGIALYLITNAS